MVLGFPKHVNGFILHNLTIHLEKILGCRFTIFGDTIRARHIHQRHQNRLLVDVADLLCNLFAILFQRQKFLPDL